MKNKLAYLLSFAVVAAAAGCNKKFLEEMKSYEKYDESMFTSETLTGAYIDRHYNNYFASYRDPRLSLVGSYEPTRSQSTEEVGGTVTNWTNPNRQLLQASQADTYLGDAPKSSIDNKAYTRIRFCNFLIEKINEGAAAALTEDFKKTAKGQMYFLRGLQYLDLVRVYGGVPIVTEVQDASLTDESIRTPRAKTSEVFDQIARDFDSAAANLPRVWTTITTDYGRPTAAAALAMKSRALLTAASPLFNPNWDNPGDERWQKALDAGLKADIEAKAGGYGASINSAKDWAEAAYKFDQASGISTTQQGEGLFIIPLSGTNSASGVINSSWENAIRTTDAKGSGGISAPKAMLDLFPTDDGSRPVIGVNYNDTFFFEKRDPRFYRTFAFSGAKWGVKNNANRVQWLYRWKESATKTPTYYGNNSVNSPAVVRKNSNPNADSTAFNFSGTDILDYRYGELLLNIAECYAAQGKITECVEYLKKIRQRVYPSSASANNFGIGTPASRYAALEACLYERRVELAYEGKRFWDMQRWMLYDDHAEIGDNTNALLNIPKLNGTSRQGYYWQLKTFTKNDLLTAADRNISIDPDASDFTTQIGKLRALYEKSFIMTPLDQAWDRDGNVAVNILFRSNYYVGGLHSALLSSNTWLPQTKGWQDYNGAMGTFDYRQ